MIGLNTTEPAAGSISFARTDSKFGDLSLNQSATHQGAAVLIKKQTATCLRVMPR
jgi:hypothetical protein